MRAVVKSTPLNFSVMDALVEAATVASDPVKRTIQARAPKRTGNLARGIYMTRKTEPPRVALEARTHVVYTKYVIEGTGLYGPTGQRIYPVQAKVLRWRESGQTMFARSVAGQHPNNFVKAAENTALDSFALFIKRSMETRAKGL